LVLEEFEIDGFSIGNGIIQFSYGMALAFGLIPWHEYIHVLAYKSKGAKNASYDANLKNLFLWQLLISSWRVKKSYKLLHLHRLL